MNATWLLLFNLGFSASGAAAPSGVGATVLMVSGVLRSGPRIG